VIVTFLERLCAASGHRFRPLCFFVVHQDAWWLGHNPARAAAAPVHCEMRERFESGVKGLPFPSAVHVPESAAPENAASRATRRKRQAKSA
jgi:hypothetical protein